MPNLVRILFVFTVFAIVGCDSADKAEKSIPPATANGSQVAQEDSAANKRESSVERVDVTPSSVNEKNPAIDTESKTETVDSDFPKSSGDIPMSLKFLAWNVESDGSDPNTICKQLEELGRYDVIALTEVLPTAAKDFCAAFGDDYNYVMTETGRSDRMMLIYNKNALQFIRKSELHDINFQSRYRSPLVVHLKDQFSGQEFLVLVNHLARGSEEKRQIQAKKLVQWARNESMPIIALGDYNFDYVFKTRQGNEAFRLFMKDNIWKWIEPIELIDTNWYDNPEEPDGKDDYPGSMLDFGFVAGPAKKWTTSCKVIVREGDFPDDEKTSDHRPYEMIISGR